VIEARGALGLSREDILMDREARISLEEQELAGVCRHT
jgi:hypothetical protein